MVNLVELPREALTRSFTHLFANNPPPPYLVGDVELTHDEILRNMMDESYQNVYTDEYVHPDITLSRSPEHAVLQTCHFLYVAGIIHYRATESRRMTESGQPVVLTPYIDLIGNGKDCFTTRNKDPTVFDYLYQRGHKVEHLYWDSAYTFTIEDRSELMASASFIPRVLPTDQEFYTAYESWANNMQNLPWFKIRFKVIRTQAMCLETKSFHELHASFTILLGAECTIDPLRNIRPLHDEEIKDESPSDCGCELKLDNILRKGNRKNR